MADRRATAARARELAAWLGSTIASHHWRRGRAAELTRLINRLAKRPGAK